MSPVALGRIGAPHGVRGWLRVQSWTRPPEAILDFERWLVGTPEAAQPYAVLDTWVGAKGLAVRLEGIDDRDAASALKHASILVDRSELPPAEPGEWYWADLEGLRVETLEGADLGVVDHLLETGANDVLVVHGERERLVPWIPEEVVQRVEPDSERIVVDWDPDF